MNMYTLMIAGELNDCSSSRVMLELQGGCTLPDVF